MGQIAIVSLQNSNSKVIECFNVESRILCMVHVPTEGDGQEPSSPVGPEAAAGRAPGVPTVCLGTEEGRWALSLWPPVTVTAASQAQQRGLGRAVTSGSHVGRAARTCVIRSVGSVHVGAATDEARGDPVAMCAAASSLSLRSGVPPALCG